MKRLGTRLTDTQTDNSNPLDNSYFILNSTESVEELFPRVTTHVLAECRGYIFGDSRGSCLDVVVEVYIEQFVYAYIHKP